jgi:hypothetical protein
MAVVASPDIAGAVIAHLLASPEIATVAGTKISSRRKAEWNLPAYAILVEPGRGGVPLDPPFEDERFDIRCYGPNEKSANDLWRLVNSYLMRHDGGATDFVAASTRVYTVTREGGPNRLLDGDWPFTLGTYHFQYLGIPSS